MGKGRLIIRASDPLDPESAASDDIASRQLLASILAYMRSERFVPGAISLRHVSERSKNKAKRTKEQVNKKNPCPAGFSPAAFTFRLAVLGRQGIHVRGRQRLLYARWQAFRDQSRRAALSAHPPRLLGESHSVMQGAGYEHNLPVCVLERPRGGSPASSISPATMTCATS